MFDILVRCIEYICSYFTNRNRIVTSEEEVERLIHRFMLRSTTLNVNLSSLLNSVKSALFEEPVTLSCFFPDRMELDGIVLFCSHSSKPSTTDKLKAFEESVKARRILDALDIAETIFSKFFEVKPRKEGPFIVYNRGNGYRLFISSVEEAEEDIAYHFKAAKEFEENYIVVLLTERTPLPFIRFFKKNSEIIRKNNILIWVMDMYKESVNPFIGYPRDKELIKKFRNPKLATHIESLWRVRVREI
jgi:hypothetical protein